MRRSVRRLLLCAATCLSAWLSAACYESASPLDPIPQVDLDTSLLGTWHCITSDPGDRDMTLTIAPTRDRVYAVTLQEFGQELDRYEAHASLVASVALVNLRNLKTSAKPWIFVRYSLLRPKVLQLHVVDGQAVRGVDASPAMVRQSIERRIDDAALFAEACTCVRMNEK